MAIRWIIVRARVKASAVAIAATVIHQFHEAFCRAVRVAQGRTLSLRFAGAQKAGTPTGPATPPKGISTHISIAALLCTRAGALAITITSRGGGTCKVWQSPQSAGSCTFFDGFRPQPATAVLIATPVSRRLCDFVSLGPQPCILDADARGRTLVVAECVSRHGYEEEGKEGMRPDGTSAFLCEPQHDARHTPLKQLWAVRNDDLSHPRQRSPHGARLFVDMRPAAQDG